MTKTLFSLSMVCLLSLVTISSAAENMQNYAEYFAGIQLLSSDKLLTPQQKKVRYKKLCELSGVTAEQAKLFLNNCKNNPTQWQDFQKTVLEVLKKSDAKQTAAVQNASQPNNDKQKDSLPKVNLNNSTKRTDSLLKTKPSGRKL